MGGSSWVERAQGPGFCRGGGACYRWFRGEGRRSMRPASSAAPHALPSREQTKGASMRLRIALGAVMVVALSAVAALDRYRRRFPGNNYTCTGGDFGPRRPLPPSRRGTTPTSRLWVCATSCPVPRSTSPATSTSRPVACSTRNPSRRRSTSDTTSRPVRVRSSAGLSAENTPDFDGTSVHRRPDEQTASPSTGTSPPRGHRPARNHGQRERLAGGGGGEIPWAIKENTIGRNLMSAT